MAKRGKVTHNKTNAIHRCMDENKNLKQKTDIEKIKKNEMYESVLDALKIKKDGKK